MNEKIKILYIINSLNIGGSEKVLMDSANNLDLNRYSVSIISLSLFNPDKTIFKICSLKPGIEIFYFDFEFYGDYSIAGYIRLLLKKKNSYREIEAITALIHKMNPQIIHFHTSPRELILNKFFNFKAQYVFTDHTLRIGKNELGTIREKILSGIFRKLYSGFNIIAVSEEIRKNLYARNIVSSQRTILTILNGVDITFFQNKAESENPEGLAAVYVSRIDNNKGHEDLVRAWAQLTDIHSKKLYLVGPDSLNGKIQALAKELGCETTIEFTGAVTDPKTILLKCNLAIFPSYKEGLPLSLLEKMAMRIPVIISNIEELTTIITNNENGLVFKLGNATDLAEKIRYLYLNPKVAETLGKNARTTVELKYDSTATIKKLDALYTTLLN